MMVCAVGQLPTPVQLAIVHASLLALMSRTSNRRRMLSAVGSHHTGQRRDLWSVMSDGGVL